jgi:hypothetical protein
VVGRPAAPPISAVILSDRRPGPPLPLSAYRAQPFIARPGGNVAEREIPVKRGGRRLPTPPPGHYNDLPNTWFQRANEPGQLLEAYEDRRPASVTCHGWRAVLMPGGRDPALGFNDSVGSFCEKLL